MSFYSNPVLIWNVHSPQFLQKRLPLTFSSPTLTFRFSWLCGLEVDLFSRLPLLMEWLWLSWLPLTHSPWLHRAMALLCQDKVKDHSKTLPRPCSTFNQTSMQDSNSERMHREIRKERRKNEQRSPQKPWMRAVRETSVSILAAVLICSVEHLWSREMEE